jgi:hypothetical protein
MVCFLFASERLHKLSLLGPLTLHSASPPGLTSLSLSLVTASPVGPCGIPCLLHMSAYQVTVILCLLTHVPSMVHQHISAIFFFISSD